MTIPLGCAYGDFPALTYVWTDLILHLVCLICLFEVISRTTQALASSSR